MTMKLKDFEKLKSLMRMTASDADSEALQAIRQANKLLMRDYGLTWDQVFGRCVTVVTEVEGAPDDQMERPPTDTRSQPRYETTPTDYAAQVERDFADAMESASDSFADFLDSLRRQWLERHSLSPRQREVLANAAQRARER